MGLILSLDNSIHSFNTGKFVLDQYTGAEAGYSLRRLSVNTTDVVRVRRSSDNAEADFTAAEVADGIMTAWVNTEYETVTNGEFTTDSGWSKGTGWSIANGKASSDGTQTGVSYLFQSSNMGASQSQRVTLVVSGYTAGTVRVRLGNSAPNSSITPHVSSNGTHVFTLPSHTDPSVLFIEADANFQGSIESISVVQLTSDGYVTTWYDQSGNSNDATQATAASQPKIVSAGSLITSNGYQVIQYDGTDDNLTTSLTATGTMLMSGSDGGDFYEVAINGSYNLLASASNTDHPLRESIRVIWSSSLTTAQKTAIENLITYTDWDFSDVTSFGSYWRARTELTDFPLIDTSSGTNFIFAWFGCSSLTSFSLLDVSSGTNFRFAWSACSSLTSFPQLDVSNGTNFQEAWIGCSSLTTFPLLDVSSGTNFNNTWQGCSSITSFPLLDVSSGTTFSNTWRDCSSLTSFPALDVSSGTSFALAWVNCTSLTSFPANMFDSVTATNFTSAFNNTNLSSQSIENIVVSIDTAGQSNGTLNITGGGNATTATAQTAIDNLRGRGWTVTVPDGY